MNSADAYLVLNLLPKVGPVRARNLVRQFGSPESALAASASEVRRVEGFGDELAPVVAGWHDLVDLDAEKEKIADRGLTILTPEDDLFPALLKATHSPPLILYVWGQLTPADRHAIAIVGSRKTSHYGTGAAKKIGFQLAHAGLTVISGLARGIDTAAHEAALAAGGRTVAVLGSGLGQLYPPENLGLAERIADGNGAVVTEFPVDSPPDKQSFPLRNRIVAGWSIGIVVVEAPARSGALITANMAGEMGRSLYAVPGPIDRPGSAGCNRLIQDGAKLITGGGDVLDDLDTLFPTAPHAPVLAEAEGNRVPDGLSQDESRLYSALANDELGIDELIDTTGLPGPTISATLMRLEMKRLVKQLPGPALSASSDGRGGVDRAAP